MREALRRAVCAVQVAVMLFWPPIALAGPDDPSVAGGSATVSKPDAATTLIQQRSDRAVIRWKGFSIDVNELVKVEQPGAESVLLNKVTGGDPSNILGSLVANGRVFIVNPNGVVFGPGSRVDAAGILATTFGIDDDAFMNGAYQFAQDPNARLAAIVNQGEIRVSDNGFVFLVAPAVANEGLIIANLGKVVLGSGTGLTIDFMGDGLVTWEIDGKVLDEVRSADGKRLDAAVSNSGEIQAEGGAVLLSAKAGERVFQSVVSNTGRIEARSLVSRGGVVRLEGGDPVENTGELGWEAHLGEVQDAEGVVRHEGSIDVSAAEEGALPGEATVSGESVYVSGSIDARGGGDVLVTSSARTVVTRDAVIDVSGDAWQAVTIDGELVGTGKAHDAGNAAVWSDGRTWYFGTIVGRGGEAGGSGADVEVSGHRGLVEHGQFDLSAPNGTLGSILLDPPAVVLNPGAFDGDDTIDLAAGADPNSFAGDTGLLGTVLNGDAFPTSIFESEIEGLVGFVGTFLIEATGDGANAVTSSGAFTLDLTNGGTVFGTGLTVRHTGAAVGAIDLSTNPVTILANTGNVTIRGGDSGANAGDVTVFSITTTTGNISVTTGNGALNFGAGAALSTTTGSVTVTTAAGTLDFGAGMVISTTTGDLVASATGLVRTNGLSNFDVGGNASITSTASDVALGFAPGDDVRFGTVTLSGGDVALNEGDGTTFFGATSATVALTVFSAGAIDDGAAATISSTGAAFFDATGAITLDNAASHNFFSLRVDGTDVTVREISDMLLAGASVGTGTVNLRSETGSVNDAGGAGDTVTATSLSITASTGIGALANTLSTTATNFEGTTVTGGVFLANAGALTLRDIASADGVAVSITGAGTDIDISATSPLTVLDNVTAPGNVTLTAGELNDPGVCADDLTIGDGAGPEGPVLVESTGANVTLQAGDDVIVETDATIRALVGTVTVTAAFTDADGCGSPVIRGVIDSANIALTSPNDIYLGTLTATGTLTLTAGTDGTGSIIDLTPGSLLAPGANNITATNVVLNAAGVTADYNNDGDTTDPGEVLTTGLNAIEVDITADTLQANVTTGAGAIEVRDLAGGLTLQRGETADGNVSVGTTGGGLLVASPSATNPTFGIDAGGAGNVNLSNATGDITVGDGTLDALVGVPNIIATGDRVTLFAAGAIVDGDVGARRTMADASEVVLRGLAGIGVLLPAVLTASSLSVVADTGAVNVTNLTDVTVADLSGAMADDPEGSALAAFVEVDGRATGRGFHDPAVGTAVSLTLIATDPAITIAADVIWGGTLTFEAFESVVPGAGDDITVNDGVRVLSTAGSLFLRAGDNVIVNGDGAGTDGTAAGATGVTVEANFGDNDGLGSVTVGGIVGQDAGSGVTATTVSISSRNDVTLGGATDGRVISTGTTTIVAGSDGTGALVLGSLTAATANLFSAGTITDDAGGSVFVTGTTGLTATDGLGTVFDVLLDNPGNNFGTVLVNAANNVTIADLNGVDFGASDVSGNLVVTAIGAISDSGVVRVTGTTSLAAGAANDITFDLADDFGGAVTIVSGNNVTLNDTGSLTFAASTISGFLNATAPAGITQVGAITVGTTSTFNTSSSDVTLTDAANDFVGAVSSTSRNVSLRDANAIVLGASTISGNLSVQSGGAAGNTITDVGALSVTGTTTLIAGTADVTLDNANDFVGAVTVTSAATVTLNDVDALTFGGVSLLSGSLVVTAGGLISDAAGTAISALGTVSFTTTGGGIALADNGGDVLLAFGNATFTAAGLPISVGVAGLVDSGATVDFGSLTFTGSTVTVSEDSGMLIAGAATATGTATLTSETGSVEDAGGVGDTVTATSLSVSALTGVGSANPLDTLVATLEATTATGGVTVANAGALTLDDVNTADGAAVFVTVAGGVTISTLSPLDVAEDVLAPGDVILSAGEIPDAPICADDLTVEGGATVTSTGGDVFLFAGDDVVLLAGSVVSAFDDLTIAAGFGDLDACGGVTMGGTISAGGTITITGIGDIVLGFINAPGGLDLTTAGSILDGNGDDLNVILGGFSRWTAGGVIGLPEDPIEVFMPDGEQLITDAGRAVDEVSVSLRGGLDPFDRPFMTATPPGLVLFDYHVFGGANIETFHQFTAELNIRSTGERDHGERGFWTSQTLYLEETTSPEALYEWDPGR